MIFKAPLEARIATLIANPATASSASVADLLEEAVDALEAAEADAAKAERAALDPALGPDEAERARLDLDKSQFRVKRLAVAVDRLGQLRGEREEAEAESVRVTAYNRARDLRDQAATLIKSKYPAIQRDLMQIIDLIAAAQGPVSHANRDLPKGYEHLHFAEAVAFDYPNNSKERPIGWMPPKIAEMMIPDIGNWGVPAWPPNWNSQHGRPQEQVIEGWLFNHAKKGNGKK